MWSLRTPSRKWADLTSSASMAVTSGRILLLRDGHRRVLAFDQLALTEPGSGSLLILPAADRPAFTEAALMYGVSNRAQVNTVGNVGLFGAGPLVIGRIEWTIEGVA